MGVVDRFRIFLCISEDVAERNLYKVRDECMKKIARKGDDWSKLSERTATKVAARKLKRKQNKWVSRGLVKLLVMEMGFVQEGSRMQNINGKWIEW